MGFRNPLTSLRPDQIRAGTLPLSVVATALADGTVTAPKIATGAVRADHIEAGAVLADRLAVGVLQSSPLRNAGFEDTGQAMATPGVRASVPAWTIGGGPAAAGQNFRYGADQFPPRTGNGYALLSNNGSGADGSWLRQVVPAVPGYAYRASVWLRTAYGETNNTAILVVYRSTDGGLTWPTAEYTITPALTSSYTEATVTTAVLPAGVTHLRFELRHFGNNGAAGGGGFVLADDCALVRVGAPAVEVTPGGIRMFNAAGQETITLDGEQALIRAATVTAENRLRFGSSSDAAASGYLGWSDALGTLVLYSGPYTGVNELAVRIMGRAAPTRLSIIGPATTTSPANLYQAAGGEVSRVSSLRALKLDRQAIPLLPAVLELEPVTWRDKAMVEADPNTTVRVPGLVAEDVQDLSNRHGGALDALLMREADGSLSGVAYDRLCAYLIPIIRDQAERLARLEEQP